MIMTLKRLDEKIENKKLERNYSVLKEIEIEPPKTRSMSGTSLESFSSLGILINYDKSNC
jgi:hypothetical protein